MTKYVLKRLGVGVLAIVISLCINFVLMRMAPGDPITIMAGVENPNPEMIEALTEKYGLDKPIIVQYGKYLGQLLQGDLGFSYRNTREVADLIGERLSATLVLTLSGMIISFIIGTLLGLLAARKKDTISDKFFSSVSYVLDSMPSFWLALMLILVFASTLGWFPTSGMTSLRNNYTGVRYILDLAHHLFLPVLCLVLLQFPSYYRIMRSSIIQCSNEEYVTFFKATGMKQKGIFKKFVFKNGILPTLTVFGVNVAYSFVGASLVEVVFSWPGMGSLLLTSITSRDYPVISGIYLVLSVCIVVVIVLLDILNAYLDPRIRLR